MEIELLKKASKIKDNIDHLEKIISRLDIKINCDGEKLWLYKYVDFNLDEVNKKITNNIKQQLRRKRDKLKNELKQL